jgi:hypothetical protein
MQIGRDGADSTRPEKHACSAHAWEQSRHKIVISLLFTVTHYRYSLPLLVKVTLFFGKYAQRCKEYMYFQRRLHFELQYISSWGDFSLVDISLKIAQHHSIRNRRKIRLIESYLKNVLGLCGRCLSVRDPPPCPRFLFGVLSQFCRF